MNEELEQLKNEMNLIDSTIEYLEYEIEITENEKQQKNIRNTININQELSLEIFGKICRIEAEIIKSHNEKKELLKELKPTKTITTIKRGKKL